ncbi:MAG: glycosyltransferase family 4 protein [Actinomycetota bacterium]
MKLLFVVHRYGTDISGGSETMCRQFAEHLVARGHEVDVLTSCARSYVDWANALPPGTTVEGGVTLHRLSVEAPRDPGLFGPLDQRALRSGLSVAPPVERSWLTMIGPCMPDLVPWLTENTSSYDLCVFFTYLYTSTTSGISVAARIRPVVLHPTAHHEPPLYMCAFDSVFASADAFGFLTEEEADLVHERFGLVRPSVITGIGTDLDATGDGQRFRRRFGLGDRPYLLYLGRLDTGKGADELHLFLRWYRKRHNTDLALVYIGDPVMPMPESDDIRILGFLDDQLTRDAIDGCLALAQPSYFESFSMALTEAWAQHKPALVQGHCAVLRGQALRSGGAIPFSSFADFEVALEMLEEDEQLGPALGAAGRRYVERHYRWDAVMERYEELLAGVRSGRRHAD